MNPSINPTPFVGRCAAILAVLLPLCVPVHLRAAGTVSDATESALRFAMTGGGDVVFDVSGTVALANPIVVDSDTRLICTNHAVILSGSGGTVPVRHFTVQSGVTLEITGLWLANGSNNYGGSINNAGTLVLNSCVFSNNMAVGADGITGTAGTSEGNTGGKGGDGWYGFPASGGAIYSSGSLTVNTCTFVTNRVYGGNGGAGGAGGSGLSINGNGGNGGLGATAYGGAIFADGSLEITDTLFRFNNAVGGDGGAGGIAGTNTSALAGYQGTGEAGGAGKGGAVFAGDYSIARCTFDRNNAFGGNAANAGEAMNNGPTGRNGADALGGGLVLTGTGEMVNCTFYRNSAVGGKGGDGGTGGFQGGTGGDGGYAFGGSAHFTGQGTVQNCTFSTGGVYPGTNGAAGDGPYVGKAGNMGIACGGNLANSGLNSPTLANSILSSALGSSNTFGSFLNGGCNLSTDNSPATLPAGSKYRTASQLGLVALANNGGPTPTMAIPINSIAVDAIPSGAPATDQRGVIRPQGYGADIGAFEYSQRPSISSQPASQTVNEGATVSFTVGTSFPDPSIVYQWLLDGSELTDETNSTLRITDVNVSDAGIYSVILSNLLGSVTSSNATLTVIAEGPPVFTSQPTNLTVAKGGIATFKCQATGNPAPGYRWYFNGTNLLNSTTNSQAVASADTNKAGSYCVVITNVHGSVTSSVATLSLISKPWIITQPVNQVVTNGQTASFSIVPGMASPVPSIQWYSGSNHLIRGATSATYSLDANPTNEGKYFVILTNTSGSCTSTIVTLQVVSPPMFVVQPTNLTIHLGSNALFTASATGVPGPTYQWLSNNVPIPGATSNALSILNARTNAAATYSVAVSNTYGLLVSTNAVLTVQYAPVIVQQPANTTTTNGQTASLSLVAGGVPMPVCRWYRNGSPSAPVATANPWIIPGADSSNAGMYFAVVSNSFGSATSYLASITVLVPAQILTQPFNIVAMQGANVTNWVQVAGNPAPLCQWRFNGSILTNETRTSLILSNIQPSNAGSYSVTVINSLYATNSSSATLTVITNVPGKAVIQVGPSDARISIKSEVGRIYTLQYKPELNSEQPWLNMDSAMGTGGVITLEDPYPPELEGYYRVMVQ
jgi:hypothetical protein